ncbi:hypothetical protein [Desulfovibrio piger]|uniref:hypothetical protein n=1 Tax=Desulfovibrio piger TaxID=901 RepID=UPI0026F15189|nr:hypothetical protein [Desulfovibrio piger]
MEQQRFVLLPTVGGAWVIRDTQDGSPVCVLFHGGRGMKKTRAMADVMLDALNAAVGRHAQGGKR